MVAAVYAARDAGSLDPDLPVYVELPPTEPSHQWLAAADEVAGAELRLKFRTGGLEADQLPDRAARSPRGSTRRSTARRRSSARPGCTARCATPATTASSTTASSTCSWPPCRPSTERAPDDVAATLEDRELEPVDDLVRARRWFTSFGSCSIDEPLADLRAMGLVA